MHLVGVGGLTAFGFKITRFEKHADALAGGSVLVGSSTKRHFDSLCRLHRFLILTSGPTSGPGPLVDSEVEYKKR